MLMLSACSARRSSQDLTGRIWILNQLNGVVPITGTAITAEFNQGGRVGGSSGCNSYSASYEVKGNTLSFNEPMVSTMMACPEPIMEQEREYLGVLAGTATYQIANEELTLKDSTDNVLAQFDAVDQALEGSSWQVLSYNNGKGGVTSLINGTQITAKFDQDGQVTGNAGCNTYFAEYKVDGVNISIGSAGSTEMACLEPAGVMEQEQQYLAALPSAATYKITGLNMEMRMDNGALVATYQRVTSP
jgi:heat shock protein HslJ